MHAERIGRTKVLLLAHNKIESRTGRVLSGANMFQLADGASSRVVDVCVCGCLFASVCKFVCVYVRNDDAHQPFAFIRIRSLCQPADGEQMCARVRIHRCRCILVWTHSIPTTTTAAVVVDSIAALCGVHGITEPHRWTTPRIFNEIHTHIKRTHGIL